MMVTADDYSDGFTAIYCGAVTLAIQKTFDAFETILFIFYTIEILYSYCSISNHGGGLFHKALPYGLA